MSDISFGNGYLLLADAASLFLSGFIPGFYLSYLILTKIKFQPTLTLLLSLIIGSVCGGFGFMPINQYLSNLISIYNAPWIEYILFVFAILEIAIVYTHYTFTRKQKKKTKKIPAKKMK